MREVFPILFYLHPRTTDIVAIVESDLIFGTK